MFLATNLDLLRILKADEALLLSFILNYRDFIDDRLLESNGGWFRLSKELVMQKLHMTERVHRRCFHKLEDLDIVDRAMMGNPAKRHLNVDMVALELAFDNAENKWEGAS